MYAIRSYYEDVHIINALFNTLLEYEADPTSDNALALDALFEKWYTHTTAHFEGEEIKMREMGFPPYAMHT